jgi:hypothetical protein
MSKYSIDRTPIVTNFGHRIQDYHRSATVQVGTGNANGEILVIQPHVKMPERDAITGALKNFGMLKDSYRATSLIVDYACPENIEFPCLIQHGKVTQADINRYYLRELIQIIQPALVVACGPEVLSLLRQRQVRSFSSHAGKKFKIADITCSTFFAALNPTDYGFSRAPANLKEQGKAEWTEIATIYRQLKEKMAKERWAC